ncbi:MAG: hypothetical protein H6730_34165 [Deltaproteobacteria bacterium]|nr:hypothetical protein [Deltaproteobacteria bacterium]
MERAGFSTVTVLRPGGDDLRIPVPRRPDPTRAAGIRGGVDMSKLPSSDVQAAVVYSARPLDLFEYRAFPNVDLVRTKIDAEQLDLHREGDLPGNLVFGLGEEEFTRDSTRCADDEPGLGCFVTRAPAGLTAAWVTGGEYTLSQISDARDGYATETPDRYTPADRARLIQFLSPFLASGWYGARAYLDLDDAPKVPAPPGDADCADPSVARTARCRGDFDSVHLIFSELPRASITTAVKVPELPPLPGGGCAGTMIVSAYAALTGRGFVLMGIGSADDSSDRTRVDCVVEGARRPFGALSKPLDDGFVALTSAPPHSGLEGADKLLVLATLDVEPGGTRPLDLNLLFVPFERLDSELDLSSRRFLEPAAATVSSSTGIVTSTPPTGATGVRLTATNADGTWIVYAPASMSRIDLPDRPAARAVLADPTFAMLQAFELNDEYASLWNARQPVGFDPEQMRALVTTQCGPDGPCTLE